MPLLQFDSNSVRTVRACRPQVHREFRKPLIVIAPKKLLRLKDACSTLEEMGKDTMFYRVFLEVPRNFIRRLLVKIFGADSTDWRLAVNPCWWMRFAEAVPGLLRNCLTCCSTLPASGRHGSRCSRLYKDHVPHAMGAVAFRDCQKSWGSYSWLLRFSYP